jgi:hypothetical protein
MNCPALLENFNNHKVGRFVFADTKKIVCGSSNDNGMILKDSRVVDG